MKISNLLLTLILLIAQNTVFAQQTNKKMTNSQIVEKFLDGFNDPVKIQESLALLSDDYIFKNPMVQLNSKAEFISLAQEMGKVLTGLEIIQIAEENEWVAASYIFKSSIPGLESNLGTEWFRVENGIIHESYLIYDATEWRKVYLQMGEK